MAVGAGVVWAELVLAGLLVLVDLLVRRADPDTLAGARGGQRGPGQRPRHFVPGVQACRAERGLLPNFVAVDFYGEGDLFDVVDELNGAG